MRDRRVKDNIVDLDEIYRKAHDRIYEEYGERVPISVIKRAFESQLIGTKLAMLELRTIKWNGLGLFKMTEKRKDTYLKLMELRANGLSGAELHLALKEYLHNKYGKG